MAGIDTRDPATRALYKRIGEFLAAHALDPSPANYALVHELMTVKGSPLAQMVEEMTGETFTFTERLEVYDDYVPDLQASDADPSTRGLAELCLVLLNSNAFVYVD